MQSRRTFLKTAGLLTAVLSAASTKTANAGPENILSPDRFGVLVDTTVCLGCRMCEWACKKAHGFEIPTILPEGEENQKVFERMRRPDAKTLTVVNKFEKQPTLPSGHPAKEGTSTFFTKIQCMHCDKPACVSACIVGAISKIEDGSVIWDTDKCIGCRYCMVACPFQIPAFEYDKPLQPDIKKCDFCVERTKEGLLPACVENCPVEALLYGPRTELIKIAREKIKKYPERYVNHIYGENEVGGTSWMYLARTDLAEARIFPKLSTNPAPGVSETIQHGIFAYFVPPALLYALLGGIMWLTKKKKEREKEASL
jgi:formate dehydrogenase iron-sulfur subunit